MRKLLTLAGAFAAAASLGLAPATAVHAQKGGGGGGSTITLRVCNNTRDTAQVAISYQPIGSSNFRNEGWYNVNPYSCRDLATTANSYMYGYAEVQGSDTEVWSGSHYLCVEYPGPYDFYNNPNYHSCASYQQDRGFVELYAANFGVFTWNLDP